MNNVKNIIIKLLGGYTPQEFNREHNSRAFFQTKYQEIKSKKESK